ncbi:MAG: electron transfer flavoprotein subunit alpha/FixB family protein [Proteobacteria bacterium]|nr:electron transfer flavoprotein subunit alpha/FixB family protein [Pseudomonadota bacterium]
MKNNAIVAIAEHSGGSINPATYEVVAFARKIQEQAPADLKVLIIGDDVTSQSREISRTTGVDVVAVKVPELASYNAEVYKSVLAELVLELEAKYICTANTTQGLDYAPGLAMRIDAACITGVEQLICDDNNISFSRAVFGGKVIANVIANTQAVVLTIQPGAFRSVENKAEANGSLEMRSAQCRPEHSRNLGIKSPESDNSQLTEAEVIVAAGRGIGSEENLVLLERLASHFSRSAIVGSRPVCDSGWLKLSQQVGQTGVVVAPKLYLACGISGAAQHLAGIRGSSFIVSINRDPNAAIFNESDICIIEDLSTFLGTLLRYML